jgi:hypothetical protein
VGLFSGPQPWYISGSMAIKVLVFEVSLSFEKQIGEAKPPELPLAKDPLLDLIAALEDPRKCEHVGCCARNQSHRESGFGASVGSGESHAGGAAAQYQDRLYG